MEIVKASAGSGKTFTLARKYITLLFRKQDRYAYRHILAVTFTNKATDEMKTRIMKELFILATEPEKSGYIRYFMPEYDADGSPAGGMEEKDIVWELPGKPGQKITLESLADSAQDMLCNILHDYSAFAVSTIDRFFQQTLKAFSREIGQFASYKVELDKDSLVTESVDRVLDALTEENPVLLRWLTDSVIEQIEQGGRYNLESSLSGIAGRLKSDEHRALVEKFGIDEKKVYSRENLSAIRSACRKTIKAFTDSVRDLAGHLLSMIEDAGVAPEDFNRGFMKALRPYYSAGSGDIIESPSDSFLSKAADYGQWFPKSRAKTMLPKVYPLIEAPLADFCRLFGDEFKVYRTALILDDQLYGLGIAADLYREFNALMKEKNVLSIDDSNTILKDIIDGSDAPFIYEKTGVRYENFLLDEFQDTSRIQWDNFRPLLRNSESQGFDSLIVGDVKQSIYRWRGSDWNMLDAEVKEEFPEAEEMTLDTNYRSSRNIVAFNNAFFPVVAGMLDTQYGEPDGRSIADIYSDVRQKLPSRPLPDGQVQIMFCEKDLEAEKVLATVNMLRGKGVGYGEMTVLVRNNSSGADIASYLIANGVPVITDDSLRVKSSVTVRRLCSLLSYADNPADTVNGYLASSLSLEMPEGCHSVVDLCEALLRSLREVDSGLFDSEVLYIQSFIDAVQDYVNVNGNSLHDFLGYWEDADPAISSPSAGDSLRVMTIHKSKGLDFRYVIFPYVETVTLFKAGSHWCRPDLAGTPLSEASEGLYDVTLSSRSGQTLFADDYRKELKMQYVDNINTIYVAFTRAVRGMYLIAGLPSGKFRQNTADGIPGPVSDFSQILYRFAHMAGSVAGCPELCRTAGDDGTLTYSAGDIPESAPERRPESPALESGYPSWPLNDKQSGKVRLSFSRDSSDFFSADGRTGAGASMRLKGIVLHEILSRVETSADLGDAVEASVMAGDMDEEDGKEAFRMLSERIASAAGRGWFPDADGNVHYSAGCPGADGSMSARCLSVRRESDLIDEDGSISRPDRVVENSDGNVFIVDYKFGQREPHSERRYMRQIAGYADIYRRMGYGKVTAALWYVPENIVVYDDGLSL